MSAELFSSIRSRVPIRIANLDDQEEDVKDKTIRWLRSIDDRELNRFTYEANRYVRMLLRLYFMLWLSNDEQKANHYKEIADQIEQLSWARTNTDYFEITEAVPRLQLKLSQPS